MASTRVVDELRRRGGVGAWGAVAAATSASAVGRAVASPSVTLALPGVLVLTDLLADPAVRVEASLLYAGEDAQLSHLSALQRHGLPVPEHLASAVHVLVPHRRRRRSQRQTPLAVVVHRSRTESRPALRHGFPTSTPEQAVVESWPLLRGPDQRAPALVAIRRRLLTVGRLRAEVDRHRQVVQRPGLARLVGRLDAGCRESAWRTVQVRRTQLLGTALPHLVPLAEPVGADGPRLRLELTHRS